MANASANALVAGGVEVGIVAAGANQAAATPLPGGHNVVGTAAASTGVVLPANSSTGMMNTVANAGANAVSLYPPVGGRINGGTLNAAVSIPVGKCAVAFALANGLDWNVAVG